MVRLIYTHVNNSPNRLQRFATMAQLLNAVEEEGGDDDGERSGPTYTFLKFKKVRKLVL